MGARRQLNSYTWLSETSRLCRIPPHYRKRRYTCRRSSIRRWRICSLRRPHMTTESVHARRTEVQRRRCGMHTMHFAKPWSARSPTAWRCFAAFQAKSRSMKKTAIRIKKEKIMLTLTKLEDAASKGDQIRAYQAARCLAPWKANGRPKFRGAEGQMLNTQQQLKLMLEHSYKKFCQQEDYHPGKQLQRGIWITCRCDALFSVEILPWASCQAHRTTPAMGMVRIQAW